MTDRTHGAYNLALEILKQFGGHQFTVMTGAKNIDYGTEKNGNGYMSFKFAGSRVANHCRITLEANDTYTVVFIKVRGNSFTELKPIEGVYCDMLRGCFEGMTGLRTSLIQSFAA